MPTLPTLILMAVIATLYATLFHLLWGKSLKELLVLWLAALVGFAAGQFLATSLALRDIQIGELHLLSASATCWLAMAFARQLKL